MKLVFIDVDGTLIDSFAQVPESARKAIIQARKNGHLVFINTGRCRAQVFKYIEEIGFDGFICSDGNYVEYNGQVLKRESMNSSQIDKINAFLNKNNYGFMAEGHDKFLVNSIFINQLREKIGNSNFERFEKVFPFSRIVENVPYDGIGKVNFPSVNDISEQLKKDFGKDFSISFFRSDISPAGMMSLYLPDFNKMKGIDFLLDHLKLNEVETYAFGDTLGDLEMITGCDYGICVGNGDERLKAKADFVTDTVSNDGLYKAFEKYGLI